MTNCCAHGNHTLSPLTEVIYTLHQQHEQAWFTCICSKVKSRQNSMAITHTDATQVKVTFSNSNLDETHTGCGTTFPGGKSPCVREELSAGMVVPPSQPQQDTWTGLCQPGILSTQNKACSCHPAGAELIALVVSNPDSIQKINLLYTFYRSVVVL